MITASLPRATAPNSDILEEASGAFVITRTKGNILHCNADAIVNAVNCVGVMGIGLALQFKKAYPANFEYYRTKCDHGEVTTAMCLFSKGRT